MSDLPVIPDLDVRILRLKPGDVVALTYPDDLTVEQAARLKAMGEESFGCPVIVLSGGVDAAVVIRQAERL